MSSEPVSFDSASSALFTFSDEDFLKAIRWERASNTAVRQASAAGDVNAFRTAWLQACPAQASAFTATCLWSRPAFPSEAELIPMLEDVIGAPSKARASQRRPANKSTRSFAQRVETLVYALTAEPPTASSGSASLGLIASLELLTGSAARLRPQHFCRLWRHALTQAILQANTPDQTDPTVPADVQLVEQGEIPFVAGLLFDGVAGAASLMKAGRKKLARELVAQTDTDGTPHAELIERLSLWLAPLVRATQAARAFDTRLWTSIQEELLKSLVERAIPLCRPDGRAALSNGLRLEPLPVLVSAAEICGLAPMGSIGTYLQSVERMTTGKSPRRTRNDGVTLMPSNQSDFAKFALLRSDWTVKADSVAMAHHRRYPQLDVTAAGRLLFHGDWTLQLRIGDVPVELADEWTCVCWQSDPDADYIELQMQGPGKLRVERIAMLSRTQRFLLLADSISGVPRQRIEYRSQLPIGEGVQAKVDTPTREIQLTMKGFRSRVFPLSIPQDRVLSTPHAFTADNGQLTSEHTVEDEGLFVPLVFDWDPNRARTDAQWRTLTVTEDGRVVGRGTAAGHRLKTGNLQLLVYRSLKSPGTARAVLGHHTHNETVIARVDKNGDVDPILMVE